jgi:Flp pilus assembly protein TadG
MSHGRCSKFSHWVMAFLLASEGVSAIAFALTAPILIGMVGLGVEVGTWYVYNRRLQNAADLASLAAAVEVAYATDGTKNQALASSIVPIEVARNGIPTATLAALTVNVPPKTGSHVGDNGAVEVILTQTYARSFSALFSKDVVTERVRAVANTVNNGNFCVLALNKSVANAIWFQGSSYSNLGCGIASNSNSASSISANGSSQAYVTTARTTGGISNSGGLHATSMRTHVNSVLDPYSKLSVPTTSGLTCITQAQVNTKLSSPTHQLDPGFYCGGLSIGSNKTAILKPGVYIIAGGNFDINANANVTGNGVTIILTNTNGGPYAQVTMNGTATIQLTAQTSGPWANVLFYQDRNAPLSINSPNKINGNSNSKFRGVMYFPSTSIQLDGNATMVDSCLQVVAQTVTFIGNFTLPTACADPTFKKISGVQVSLVE